MSLNLLWTELLDKKQRPPGLKFPLEKKLKEGRGSKSRAGFGNSCSASMQGLYGAAHGPPWQQHRPPAERKDVRWQSWRGSVQQAAAGQLTCREKRRLIEERGGKQRTSYLQSKFNMKSNWNYNKTHLTVNSGSKEWAHMQDTWILPNKENRLGSVVHCSSCKVTRETRNMCKTANIQRAASKVERGVYFWLVQKQQSVLTRTQRPVLPLTLQLDHKWGLRKIYWSLENWQ